MFFGGGAAIHEHEESEDTSEDQRTDDGEGFKHG
jgi:hypothetical protein